MSEHCVQVFLKLSSKHGSEKETERITALADKLADAVEKHEAGEFDGDEYGDGVCRLLFYGPDADKLFDAIKKPLLASSLSKGGHAIKRYGEASDMMAREVRIDLWGEDAGCSLKTKTPRARAGARCLTKGCGV